MTLKPTYADRSFTPEAFAGWLTAMRAAGVGRNETECAALLGVRLTTLGQWKRRGADRRTALACSALLLNAPPYSPAAKLPRVAKPRARKAAPVG